MYLIKAKIQFEGTHYWPDAPDDVWFLRNEHRHIFTVVATLKVAHSNRDTEFILLGKAIKAYIDTNYFQRNNIVLLQQTSCEHLASVLAIQFDLAECEVYEDMENSGVYINENL